MSEKGFAPLIIVTAFAILLIAAATILLYIQKDSSTTFILPNKKASIKSTKVNPNDNQNSVINPKTGLPTIELEPARH